MKKKNECRNNSVTEKLNSIFVKEIAIPEIESAIFYSAEKTIEPYKVMRNEYMF